MTVTVRCNNCKHVFQNDEKRTIGCYCDSDAPTWIAVAPNGRVLSMSYSNYDILEETK
jgi:uncharacterized OB-fold protein